MVASSEVEYMESLNRKPLALMEQDLIFRILTLVQHSQSLWQWYNRWAIIV